MHLWPYKKTQVQVTEEGNYDRKTHFCNRFLKEIHDSVIDPKPTFFTPSEWVYQCSK
jgi:hypothetical protein